MKFKQGADEYEFTSPVSAFEPNALGINSLMGNVSEMTSIKGVAMGGNWWETQEACIRYTFGADMGAIEPDYKPYHRSHSWLGFRCVLEVYAAPKK